MQARQLIAIAMATLALGTFGSAARADNTMDDSSFSGMWKMDYIDKNKDGMVSKAEFMEMMTKAWEMKAKAMKVKGDKMTAEEFKKFKDSFLVG
jgi:Ca2+-binding EF-hand superfamily protein